MMENVLENDLLHWMKQNPGVIQKLLNLGILRTTDKSCQGYHIGKSNYSEHIIQPWHLWQEYNLNPWDADIVKRILRTKEEPGMSKEDARKMDYEKIIHICKERIRQIENNKLKDSSYIIADNEINEARIAIPKPSISFTLSPEQVEKFRKFESDNSGLCSIKFTPTGIGLGVECICGDKIENISEYDKW